MRRIVSILLMAAMLFTVRAEAPRAQGPVPLEIEQFLLSMNIPPAQIPGLYLSAVTAMAGSTTLANFFSKVPVPGGFGLGTAASQSIRITVLEQLIGGWSGFQQAVLQNLQGLARVAAGTPDAAAKFASMVGNSGNWGNRFLSLYKNLRGAPAVGRFAASRGGFVPIELLIITMTAVVFGTMGYVAGKVVLRQQDLQVKAAETQAYQSVVGNMAKGLQAGRVKLLPGLDPGGRHAEGPAQHGCQPAALCRRVRGPPAARDRRRLAGRPRGQGRGRAERHPGGPVAAGVGRAVQDRAGGHRGHAHLRRQPDQGLFRARR